MAEAAADAAGTAAAALREAEPGSEPLFGTNAASTNASGEPGVSAPAFPGKPTPTGQLVRLLSTSTSRTSKAC